MILLSLLAAGLAQAQTPGMSFDGAIPLHIEFRTAAVPPAAGAPTRDPAELAAALDRCLILLDTLPPPPAHPTPKLQPPRWRKVAPGQLPGFQDELPFGPLLDEAIPRTIAYWKKRPSGHVVVAGVTYTAAQVIRSLEALGAAIRSSTDMADLERRLDADFHVYQSLPEDAAKGDEGLATSYYTPILRMTPRPTPETPAAVYRKPAEPVTFTRKQIADGALAGRGLEIGYAAPIDLMDAHTQGSAFTSIDGRKTLLYYAGANGQRWRGVSRALRTCGINPAEYADQERYPVCAQPGFPNLMACMRTMPGDLQQKIANLEPSFVFFGTGRGLPTGAGSIELTPGRSVAVDPKYVPLGLPGLAVFKRADGEHARLVFTHDTGGAIRGGARADLYEGEGAEAGTVAASTQSTLRLYIFLLK